MNFSILNKIFFISNIIYNKLILDICNLYINIMNNILICYIFIYYLIKKYNRYKNL